MKPRNDFEKELQRYIDKGKLAKLTTKQMAQAIRYMDEEKTVKMWTFNTIQRIKGMELTKCYKVHRIGKGAAYTFFNLVLIKAVRGDNVAWAARSTGVGCMGWLIDSFSHNGDLTIKNEHDWYEYYLQNVRLTNAGKPNPYAVVRHFNLNTYYFQDSRIETIVKSGNAYDRQLLDNIMANEKPLSDTLWSAYKVAKRHDYNFQGEFWRWICLVNLLRMNGEDYRNPVNVCPANLVEAYNHMVDIKDRRLLRQRQERERVQRAEALRVTQEQEKKKMQYQNTFAQKKGMFFGVHFGNGKINITVLDSITAYKEEGESMQHCVYRNEYYKESSSLILSAKDKDGNRLATIELSLENWEVLQCRGKMNSVPKYYDEIVSLVKDNVKLFKKAKRHTRENLALAS